MPVADLHAALVTAESQLMGALLLLLQENTVSYVKARLALPRAARCHTIFTQPAPPRHRATAQAGLAVRSGWKLYQRCHRTIVEQRITDPEVVAGAPRRAASVRARTALLTVATATYFGVGVFNVVISILPPVVLRLVQVLGFSGDRELGLRLLRECLSLNAIRSPIAAFALLFYHVVLVRARAAVCHCVFAHARARTRTQQTYYCTDPAVHIAEAQRVLDVCFKRHPKVRSAAAAPFALACWLTVRPCAAARRACSSGSLRVAWRVSAATFPPPLTRFGMRTAARCAARGTRAHGRRSRDTRRPPHPPAVAAGADSSPVLL